MKARNWIIASEFFFILTFIWSFQFAVFAEGRLSARSGMAEVGEPAIYYEVEGQGEPVIFIHGGNLDRRMWDDQFELFSKNYRVVRYDVRGYGKSVRPMHPYSDEQDLYSLLQYLDLKKVHIVGLSLGGRIGIDFALTHPEMIASLVLAGPGLSGFSWSEESNAQFWKMLKAARDSSPEKAMELWYQDPYMAPAMENPKVAEKIRKIGADNIDVWLVNPLFERELDPPAVKRLSQIRVPTLVIVGSRDVPDIQKIAAMVEKDVAGAKKIVISGSGHMVNLEKPVEFNQAVLEFLKKVRMGNSG